MRKYSHLPNPTVFNAKRHKKLSYWQEVRSILSDPAMLLAIAVFIVGFAASASLQQIFN